MVEQVRGLRSTTSQLKYSHGDIKYSTGNGVAKELIPMTHGHDQRCGDGLSEWGVLVEEQKGGKNWDNCNSKFNRINFKNNSKSSF